MPLLGATGGGSAKGFGALANLGYFIRNSVRLRFNSTASSTSYFSRTNSSAPTNNKIGTLSFWVKRGIIGSQTGNGQYLIETGTGTSDSTHFSFAMNTTDVFSISQYNVEPLLTTRVFRDPAAWYHIVFVFDSTQGTAADRYKLYVNGVLETAVTRPGDCPLNSNWAILNSGQTINIGRHTSLGRGTDTYLAEWNLIDGQALTPSSFGKTDAATGQWIPKKFAGTYGTNGYYLKFSDIATTSGSNAGLGRDFSGNGNFWNTNNISVTAGTTYDAMIDSPTLSADASNYAVLNPLKIPAPASVSYTNGNLSVSCGNGNQTPALVTIYPTSGKWYWEAVWVSGTYSRIGVQNTTVASTDFAADTAGWRWESNTGNIYNGSTLATVSTYATNDVLGFCLDCDAGKLYVSKNGTWQNSAVPESGTGAVATNIPTSTLMSPAVATGSGTSVFAFNAGQRPFAYTPPTGFKSLNAFNLP